MTESESLQVLFNFGPASTGERFVYGACRPGYLDEGRVQPEVVQAWVDFMQQQGIRRVCCLLDDAQLGVYRDLLAVYRARFGAANVCSAPVPDYTVPSVAIVRERVLPFLREAEAAGEKVVVHCAAGIGRTGFALAAWLVSQRGMKPIDAIAAVERPVPWVRRDAREVEETTDQVSRVLETLR